MDCKWRVLSGKVTRRRPRDGPSAGEKGSPQPKEGAPCSHLLESESQPGLPEMESALTGPCCARDGTQPSRRRSDTHSPPYTSEVEARSRRAPTRFASPAERQDTVTFGEQGKHACTRSVLWPV